MMELDVITKKGNKMKVRIDDNAQVSVLGGPLSEYTPASILEYPQYGNVIVFNCHGQDAMIDATAEILAAYKTAVHDMIERPYNACPGLRELEAAIGEWDRYRAELNRAMDRGTGVLPSIPSVNVATLCAKYPRAAAYRKAQSYREASNRDKAAAGRTACARLEAGEDADTVIVEMEAEWAASVNRHMWD